MVASSVVIAAVGAIFGHLSAISLPHLIGFKSANSAAMIAVSSGLWLLLAIIASPKAGLFGRWLSQRKLARRILGEDILALLYRETEAFLGPVTQGRGNNTQTRVDEGSLVSKSSSGLQLHELALRLGRQVGETGSVARELLRSGYLMDSEDRWSLSDAGYRHAQNVVRSHRLWEQYLSVETGITDPRLHANAESLEHYTSSELRGELDRKIGSTAIDPHGKNIPPEG
jgi:manganese/zinc/iron transport system permease protein